MSKQLSDLLHIILIIGVALMLCEAAMSKIEARLIYYNLKKQNKTHTFSVKVILT